MSRPRVVVFGYGSLALTCLATLEDLGVVPAAVVIPGNRSGAVVDIVAAQANARRLPLLVQPPRSRIAPFLESLEPLSPDLLLVWSYSMLFPPALIALPRLGAVNLHGGLLPEYRGGHVMNWAIANGERETGVTLHYLDPGIDTGPTVAESRFPIEWNDTAATVHDKLRAAGESLLREWWPAIAAGTAPRHPQDPARGRHYRMRAAEDGRIDWSHSNDAIYNLVRALVSPWPGARTTIGGTTVVVRAALPVRESTGDRPGLVRSVDQSGVLVAAGRGSVRLTALEIDGRAADAGDLQRAGVNAGSMLA